MYLKSTNHCTVRLRKTGNAPLATGFGTVGLFVGCALGMALTPLLVGLNYSVAMTLFALITLFCTVAFFVYAQENSQHHVQPLQQSSLQEIKELLQDTQLKRVFILSFLGLGFFNGITTWLEAIMAPNGISADEAGLIGGLFILGGIGGAIAIPALSDKLKRRKPFLVICIAMGLVLVEPLCRSTALSPALVYASMLGFFFLPAYALLLAMSEELAGSEKAGMATGLLMLVGNAGGVVVIIAMNLVKRVAEWQHSVGLLVVLMLVSLGLSFFVKESYRQV